ncbi:hypothetical protein ONZ45_g14463 [Pleurotus djamor]|nr:hypothetical protein ONZ45_g14463 [Pleurotus djamor]
MLTLTRAFDVDQPPLIRPYRCDDHPCRKPYPKSIPSLLRARARAHKFDLDVTDLLGLDANTPLVFDTPLDDVNPSLTGRDADVWAKIAMLGKTGPPPPPPPPPPDAVIPKAP